MPRSMQDSSMKWLLVLIALLLAANLGVQLDLGGPSAAQAAGLPDTGAAAEATVAELKTVNKNLDAILQLLNSGTVTVKIKAPEKDAK